MGSQPCGLSCLASLAEHRAFRVCPRCNGCQGFSFSWPSNSPACGRTTLWGSVHLLMGTCAVSSFGCCESCCKPPQPRSEDPFLFDIRQEWLRGHKTLTSACRASILPVVPSLSPGPGLGTGDTAGPGQRHPCLHGAPSLEGAGYKTPALLGAMSDAEEASPPLPGSLLRVTNCPDDRAYDPHFRD